MHDFLHLFLDVLKNSILITGLVIIMMLLLEYINLNSHGKWFSGLRQRPFGQVILGAGLGLIPGCMGGFATVSMYSHKLLSFGALVAMMIASSGDEAFVMLAMIPRQALLLMGILFVVAVVVGYFVDKLHDMRNKRGSDPEGCDEGFTIHEEDEEREDHPERPTLRNLRHASVERIVLLVGVLLFTIGLAFGLFEHNHEADEALHSQLNIFNEYWLNLVFAVISLFVVWFVATAPDHVVKEHLWEHIIKKHLLGIFLWTFGALLLIQIGLQYFHIESWVSDNIPWMILLAVLIGIIPESGPHLLFVTMFATGVVPFSVLLASSISQDGHASLPLLADNKRSFAKAKVINALVAATVGFLGYSLGL
ncbi:MAG: arsenic efflux protein [Bacteroidales bacterium]|nr:arsenic efflux protein [Bacteroidales bacterium]